MRIVMTLVVRDEADVLEANLRVHRAFGVDAFCVLDNGSTDGTAEILARWSEAGLAHVTTDPDADTNEVFVEWQTRLALQAARELEADWVINNDGDEFWMPTSGDLRAAFDGVPEGSAGILAPRLEFVPRPDGPEPFWERMTLRERRTRVLPKVAHRASADIRVGPGSHHVISPSLGVEETAGKPSLRGLREKPSQPPLIAPAAFFPCAILHLPLRSFEQYRSRLEVGMRIARTREASDLEERIEAAHQEEEARERWRELIGSEESTRKRIERGELVEDARLRDVMRAIGAPGEGDLDPAPYSVPATAETREADAAELAREAIRGMTHNDAQALGERDAALRTIAAKDERLVATRAKQKGQAREFRQSLRQARRRARKLDRRLRRIERSRWWRLRPRLPGRR